jgi:hypothetical protein
VGYDDLLAMIVNDDHLPFEEEDRRMIYDGDDMVLLLMQTTSRSFKLVDFLAGYIHICNFYTPG